MLTIIETTQYTKLNMGYTHRVDCANVKGGFRPIRNWLEENKIPCSCVTSSVYLHEDHLTLFLLKWS